MSKHRRKTERAQEGTVNEVKTFGGGGAMFRKILYPIDSYESAAAASAHMKTFKQVGTQEVVALGIVELGAVPGRDEI